MFELTRESVALLPAGGGTIADLEAKLIVLPGPVVQFKGTIVAGAVLAGTIAADDLILTGSMKITDGTRAIDMTGSTVDIFGGTVRLSDEVGSIGNEHVAIDRFGVAVADPGGGTGTKYKRGSLEFTAHTAQPDYVILTSGGGLKLDQETTQKSTIVGVVHSATEPTATDYPSGTLWLQPI